MEDRLVSLKAAIDVFGDVHPLDYNAQAYLSKIKELPSAQPEPCEDAVSRRAVIDRINKQREHLQPDKYPQDKIGDAVYQICAEFIERLPSVTPKQRWIQCSERLPDREMPVWLSMCDDDVLKAMWRNGWCASNGHRIGLTDGQVIAWMPRQTVPEPYSEEGDE